MARRARVTIALDDEMMRKLKELMHKRGFLSIGEAIRHIISEYFEKLERG